MNYTEKMLKSCRRNAAECNNNKLKDNKVGKNAIGPELPWML